MLTRARLIAMYSWFKLENVLFVGALYCIFASVHLCCLKCGYFAIVAYGGTMRSAFVGADTKDFN